MFESVDPNRDASQIASIVTALSQTKRTYTQIKNLEDLTKSVPFFKEYRDHGKEDIHNRCCALMSYEKFERGQTVFSIDSSGDKFYIIIEGSVGVYIRIDRSGSTTASTVQPNEDKNNQPQPIKEELLCVKELHQGQSFGELALLQNKKRLASIICHSSCHMATLDKQSFHQVLGNSEEQKLLREMEFFADLQFFQGWNFNLLKLLYLNSSRQKFKKGQTVFKENSDSNAVYFVKSGEFELAKMFVNKPINSRQSFSQEVATSSSPRQPPTGREVKLAIYGSKEFFGEEDIFEHQNRSFSVKCIEDAEVIVLSAKDFHQRMLCDTHTRKFTIERYQMKKKKMEEKIELIQRQLLQYSDFFFFLGDTTDSILENPLLTKQSRKARKNFSSQNISLPTEHVKSEKSSSPGYEVEDLSVPNPGACGISTSFHKPKKLLPTIRSVTTIKLCNFPTVGLTKPCKTLAADCRAPIILKHPDGGMNSFGFVSAIKDNSDIPSLFKYSSKEITTITTAAASQNPLKFIKEGDGKQDLNQSSLNMRSSQNIELIKTCVSAFDNNGGMNSQVDDEFSVNDFQGESIKPDPTKGSEGQSNSLMVRSCSLENNLRGKVTKFFLPSPVCRQSASSRVIPLVTDPLFDTPTKSLRASQYYRIGRKVSSHSMQQNKAEDAPVDLIPPPPFQMTLNNKTVTSSSSKIESCSRSSHGTFHNTSSSKNLMIPNNLFSQLTELSNERSKINNHVYKKPAIKNSQSSQKIFYSFPTTPSNQYCKTHVEDEIGQQKITSKAEASRNVSSQSNYTEQSPKSRINNFSVINYNNVADSSGHSLIRNAPKTAPNRGSSRSHCDNSSSFSNPQGHLTAAMIYQRHQLKSSQQGERTREQLIQRVSNQLDTSVNSSGFDEVLHDTNNASRKLRSNEAARIFLSTSASAFKNINGSNNSSLSRIKSSTKQGRCFFEALQSPSSFKRATLHSLISRSGQASPVNSGHSKNSPSHPLSSFANSPTSSQAGSFKFFKPTESRKTLSRFEKQLRQHQSLSSNMTSTDIQPTVAASSPPRQSSPKDQEVFNFIFDTKSIITSNGSNANN